VYYITPTPEGYINPNTVGLANNPDEALLENTEELTESDCLVYVLSAVNVRERPTTSSRIIGGLVENDCLHCVGITSTGWTKVAYGHDYAYVYSNYLTTTKPQTVGTVHLDTQAYRMDALSKGYSVNVLPLNCIIQRPELPSGGEITCLAMVLNYMGYSIDKTSLATYFLDKGEAGQTNPFEAFVGDPSLNGSYGCYAPPIANAATKYFASIGSKAKATVRTDLTKADIINYVAQDIPVILWCTSNMKPSTAGKTWNLDGQKVTWKGRETAVVVIGYCVEDESFVVCDPAQGIVKYDQTIVFTRYTEQYSQAIIVTKE